MLSASVIAYRSDRSATYAALRTPSSHARKPRCSLTDASGEVRHLDRASVTADLGRLVDLIRELQSDQNDFTVR